MKKILTLILALSILFSMSIMPQAIADTKDETATDFSAELLYKLGAIDEEMKDLLLSDTNITRAQFAQTIFEVAKLTGGADGEFNDVTKGSKATNDEEIAAERPHHCTQRRHPLTEVKRPQQNVEAQHRSKYIPYIIREPQMVCILHKYHCLC